MSGPQRYQKGTERNYTAREGEAVVDIAEYREGSRDVGYKYTLLLRLGAARFLSRLSRYSSPTVVGSDYESTSPGNYVLEQTTESGIGGVESGRRQQAQPCALSLEDVFKNIPDDR